MRKQSRHKHSLTASRCRPRLQSIRGGRCCFLARKSAKHPSMWSSRRCDTLRQISMKRKHSAMLEDSPLGGRLWGSMLKLEDGKPSMAALQQVDVSKLGPFGGWLPFVSRTRSLSKGSGSKQFVRVFEDPETVFLCFPFGFPFESTPTGTLRQTQLPPRPAGAIAPPP